METVWIVLMSVFGVILTYFIVVVFIPGFEIKQPLLTKKHKRFDTPNTRQDVDIPIENTSIKAWFYIPEIADKPIPCVILSNGFGGTRDMVLEPYANRFVEKGFAAIIYDYRFFGDSGGEPRQLFNGIKQQEDLMAVINYTRNHEKIDKDRIILWTTSAAGCYGINVASIDPKIAGVIVQTPRLDHAKDDKLIFKREGIGFFVKLFIHAQRDKGRSRFGLSPHYIPVVGKPGTVAFVNAPGALEGYKEMIASSELFFNGICARSLLMRQGPDAIKTAAKVMCPVLLMVCEQDTMVSPDSYKRVAERLGDKAKVVKYPIGHFDIYNGEYFEKAINEQLDFINNILVKKEINYQEQ